MTSVTTCWICSGVISMIPLSLSSSVRSWVSRALPSGVPRYSRTDSPSLDASVSGSSPRYSSYPDMTFRNICMRFCVFTSTLILLNAAPISTWDKSGFREEKSIPERSMSLISISVNSEVSIVSLLASKEKTLASSDSLTVNRVLRSMAGSSDCSLNGRPVKTSTFELPSCSRVIS